MIVPSCKIGFTGYGQRRGAASYIDLTGIALDRFCIWALRRRKNMSTVIFSALDDHTIFKKAV